jgi:hypothetical protein
VHLDPTQPGQRDCVNRIAPFVPGVDAEPIAAKTAATTGSDRTTASFLIRRSFPERGEGMLRRS